MYVENFILSSIYTENKTRSFNHNLAVIKVKRKYKFLWQKVVCKREINKKQNNYKD